MQYGKQQMDGIDRFAFEHAGLKHRQFYKPVAEVAGGHIPTDTA